jgi:hypothetical protein
VSNKASESERVTSQTLEEREDAEKPEYKKAIRGEYKGADLGAMEERKEK